MDRAAGEHLHSLGIGIRRGGNGDCGSARSGVVDGHAPSQAAEGNERQGLAADARPAWQGGGCG